MSGLLTLQVSSDENEMDAHMQSTSTSVTYDTAPDILQSIAEISGIHTRALAHSGFQVEKT